MSGPGAKSARPLFGGTALANLLENSSEWESEPIPYAREATMLTWGGLAASAAAIGWFTIGASYLESSTYLTTPIVGPVVEFCLFTEWRVAVVGVLCGLIAASIVSAVITEGYRLAGPRLQRLTFAHGLLGLLALAPAAIAIAVAVIAIALYIALIVLACALILAVFIAMLNG